MTRARLPAAARPRVAAAARPRLRATARPRVRATAALGAIGLAVLAGGCGSSGGSGGSGGHRSDAATSTSASASAPKRGAASRPVANRSRRDRGGRYGKIPSWLPSAAPPSQRALHASFSHPVLTIQGDSLSVSLDRARMLVTAVGPTVPEIGRTPVPATSPTTFVVTFSRLTAPVSLRRSSFVLVDQEHRIHHPRVTAIHGGTPPTELRPGETVSIKLHAVLPTGDGGLEWRPDGARVIAGWDFNVEID